MNRSDARAEIADAFIQSADDRVGLLAAGLFVHTRGDAAPTPQDVTAFRFQAEQRLGAPLKTVTTVEPAQPAAPQSFWTGGDVMLNRLRLKAALSLLGLVIVMAILFRLAGGWLFGPGR